MPSIDPNHPTWVLTLREPGDHAGGAYGSEERVQGYTRFLTTCGPCHDHELKTTTLSPRRQAALVACGRDLENHARTIQ